MGDTAPIARSGRDGGCRARSAYQLTMTARAGLVCALMAGHPAIVHAQAPAVVEVSTGVRITGDVRRLARGQLEFRTPAAPRPGAQRWAGTISIVWAEVISVSSTQNLEVE